MRPCSRPGGLGSWSFVPDDNEHNSNDKEKTMSCRPEQFIVFSLSLLLCSLSSGVSAPWIRPIDFSLSSPCHCCCVHCRPAQLIVFSLSLLLCSLSSWIRAMECDNEHNSNDKEKTMKSMGRIHGTDTPDDHEHNSNDKEKTMSCSGRQ